MIEQVSGNIYAITDKYSTEGEAYIIRPGELGGWGLPVSHITPEDLRVLADRIERLRGKISAGFPQNPFNIEDNSPDKSSNSADILERPVNNVYIDSGNIMDLFNESKDF